ncbi:Aldose 1-epimerase [Lentilactobacillus parabuchneri]|jgi:galactose mutarotase-like enzyme|uniref:Aldose 1-epimerase n=2 Tax=Lentilactobacillus parabuchneri TaxID=152331 RepID=A0A1X1FBM5_9LACO|nr:aldose 1-epimerase family protein [Lentilactobacillus parabuchneri]APR08482.1 Aldose 1-epimerase [Lentilactobacillus parabuchneri]KRM47858.1 aldose 1-epimerase [Lentilactobacillus parabuchneri DSM 5707 = NBRC 107865]KRN80122.1 aldose 1-epimerase [Lentilactobacillus parabuchneri]MBW0221932.1 aldose 1-epimerase family protein [Lentilactobacillus parabuchneri]MBW0244844.1 aldose 1-epimerase family protein [Lentilactobacillus parabuchneri]
MITLKNQYLTVLINELGAELTSVKDSEGIEYIWQADPTYWKRHAPILFPIVGRLKDNQYQFNSRTYDMTQHGFARDHTFAVESQLPTKVSLVLKSNEETLVNYPFKFELRVIYELVDHSLNVSLNVINPTSETLLFSIGAHPGFNIPLVEDAGSFEDYFVRVAPKKAYSQIPLKPPYSDPNDRREIDLTKPLSLNHELFNSDAIVLDLNRQETTVMLASSVNDHGVSLTVENAPYVGIWSPYPKKAPFACIEPWWGLADTVDANGKLADKFAINKLAGRHAFAGKYQISFF